MGPSGKQCCEDNSAQQKRLCADNGTDWPPCSSAEGLAICPGSTGGAGVACQHVNVPVSMSCSETVPVPAANRTTACLLAAAVKLDGSDGWACRYSGQLVCCPQHCARAEDCAV